MTTRSILLLTFLLQFSKFVLGDIGVNEPQAGDIYKPKNGEISMSIALSDNTDYPQMADLKLFKIKLCSGANSDFDCPSSIETSLSPTEFTKSINADDGSTIYSYNISFSDSIVGSGQFFLQINGLVDSSNYAIHYSPRFLLQNMAGAVGTNTVTALTEPSADYNLPKKGGGKIDSRSFTIPYTLQTGISRFAPMQLQPGSVVTKTSWSNKYPTSTVTYYSTLAKSLEQMTTITPGWSYTFKSDFNYVSVAPFPSDNGGWYAPSKRQTLSVRKLNR
ncbi:similar to Saccharomyces cerevisiae YJL174W KRE9 Glycoprotein involved in cell wall beta-glucan assembly [Maudiozyma saulgeensis]|uniref:Similar to Saccharomyces cerevisiae YJL174W KRE9 Glycoprotein involved in cell wall beta-glucan assembly n=1 Tax=Maudiozyma saulgeensis TaxID=1789683 RepID=A0A1X7R1W0_9SACH|nr:similar to Saccharomyces cerevisiae YJL174W KRE9 Glycoprotein involved in cell wall beta-glucan assembly [Kazachstania saulgeensis]